MTYRLVNTEPYVIELFAQCGDGSEFVWRKDIRDLKYPAPDIEFVGPFTITETCPDSGRQIEHKFK